MSTPGTGAAPAADKEAAAVTTPAVGTEAARSAPATKSLVHHRDFRQLWVGDTGSQLGAALGSLAIPYLAVTTLAATPFQMGLLSTLAGLGFLVIGLPAGAMVDRRSKRKVMIAADLGRAVLLASVPISWWLGALTLGQVMAVATAVGMLTVFFDVSYQSYLPFLVPDDQVVEGNAKLQASQSVSQSAGPALGGFLLKAIGPASVIALNGCGFLLSALFLFRIRHREMVPSVSTRRPLLTEIGEGLTFVLGHRLLRRLIACTGISNFASSGGSALFVLFMLRDLHLSPLTIGIIDSAAAIGGLVGALLATRLARRIGEGPSIIVTATSMVILMFCNPMSSVLPPVPTLIIGGVALTGAVVAYNIATVSFRQRLCPPALLGRMNASSRFLVWGTIPLGAITSGVVGTHLGVLPTLWMFAGINTLALVPVASRSLWRLKALPTHDERPHDAQTA